MQEAILENKKNLERRQLIKKDIEKQEKIILKKLENNNQKKNKNMKKKN